jgi:hypothetical protein
MLSSGTRKIIDYKIAAMNANSYSPELNKNVKILTLMACHSDRVLKKYTIINNAKKINFANNDIVIINSEGTPFGNTIREETKDIVKDYFEIPNNINTLDIGKFIEGLKRHNYFNYHFVVFINDSIIINKPINHFYNIMIKRNHDLFGINSSTNICYHYQSYLYGIKSSAVINLINLYRGKRHVLNSGYWGVVSHIELDLCNQFQDKACFLDFGRMPEVRIKNGGGIFGAGFIYDLAVNTGIFPLSKVKWVKKK